MISTAKTAAEDGGLDSKRLFQQINLRRLISFDILLKHDVSTEQCKQLKHTTAVLTFKIADVSHLEGTSSGYTLKRVECSLDELKKFREEMVRIQETM